MHVRFTGLPEPDDAVGLIHDLNGDGIVAWGLFCMPAEVDAGSRLELVIHATH